MKAIPLTPHQEAVLRAEYGDRSLVDISAKLGIGVEKLRRRASRLGLRRNTDFVTKLRLRERSLKRKEFFQTMLPADAEAISACESDHPWYRMARENNEQFLELLQQEFLISG